MFVPYSQMMVAIGMVLQFGHLGVVQQSQHFRHHLGLPFKEKYWNICIEIRELSEEALIINIDMRTSTLYGISVKSHDALSLNHVKSLAEYNNTNSLTWKLT